MTTFTRLRALPAGSAQPPVQRADFHVLATVRSGQGAVTVDFVRHRLEPGAIVWIRPGRVHRWDDIAGVDGTLVLFRPESVPHGSPGADPLGPVSWRQPGRTALVRLAADHLRREYDAALASPFPGSTAIVRALLEVLLLRAGDSAPPPPAGREAFTAYAAAVEAHYAESREVAWYARRLGYSPRTLSRATRDAVGRSAKQFVDDRVVLEAKRLLTHAGVTVAECARRTGFDDPANFSKFFQARTGLAPGAFRATTATLTARLAGAFGRGHQGAQDAVVVGVGLRGIAEAAAQERVGQLVAGVGQRLLPPAPLCPKAPCPRTG